MRSLVVYTRWPEGDEENIPIQYISGIVSWYILSPVSDLQNTDLFQAGLLFQFLDTGLRA